MTSHPEWAAALSRAEWALTAINAGGTNADMERARTQFRQTVAQLEKSGPAVVPYLRSLVAAGDPLGFSKARTAARLLARLGFDDSARALVDEALSQNLISATVARQALSDLDTSEAHFKILADALTPAASVGAEVTNALIDALGRQRVPAFYALAESWLSNGDESIRRSLTLSLVIDGGSEAVRLLEMRREDRDPIVRIRALAGLVFAGQRSLVAVLIQSAETGGIEARYEALKWLGLLPLPETVEPLRQSLRASSPKLRVAALAGVSNAGVAQSLIDLSEALESTDTRTVEQAAALLVRLIGRPLPFEWKGRRLTGTSAKAVQDVSAEVSRQWIDGKRYRAGRLLTVQGLVEELVTSDAQTAFWILAGMTSQRFGFDPHVDQLKNWRSIEEWRAWAARHADAYEPGGWYYRGDVQPFKLT
jgi:HEAT repeat protein